MDYFPVFMDLRGRRCLLVGGTEAAARKARLLLDAGADVVVVAAALADGFELLVPAALQHLARTFEPADLAGVVLVIAASDVREHNRAVAHAAAERGIPVNVVDDPALCTVIVPAIVDRSPLLIAVGTGGGAPVLARYWRGRIEAHVPMGVRAVSALAADLRGEVRAALPDVLARRRFWETIFDGEVAELASSGQRSDAEQALRARLAAAVDGRNDAEARRGSVYLVGVGPNEPELVSFRALRYLQSADLVISVPDVSELIVDLARRDAERLCLPEWPVVDITGLIQRVTASVSGGQRVCLLGPGDAFRQPPGTALVSKLQSAGVRCVVVPGIT